MTKINSVPNSLFFRLRPAAALTFWSRSPDAPDEFFGPLQSGYPNFLSFPDLLLDRHSRSFVGLTFNCTDSQSASQLFSGTDRRIVTLGPSTLNIQWSSHKEVEIEGAQIAEILFFFLEQRTNIPECLVGFELRHIATILADFDLTFPNSLILGANEITWFD